jgi:hypothetical protein
MATYTYFYSGQLRTYIAQFLRIFSGFQTQDGVDRNSDGTNDYRAVTVHYGDIDRVMGSILQNQSESFVAQKLPIISGYMTGLSLDADRRQSKRHLENVAYPTSTTNVTSERLIGTPIKMNMDLYLYASNTNQLFQILEQILLLFNPTLDIQRSSNEIDWTYISKVELTAINNQQNFPVGMNRKMMIWGLSFAIDAWINFPSLTSTGVIESIITNIHDESINFPGVDLESTTTTDTTITGP